MKDEFSIVGDEYHKTLFSDDWTDVFDAIREYPLIFGGVNEGLRKYLSYLFIRKINSVDLLANGKKLGKMEKIRIGLELIGRMIEKGKLSDYNEVRVNERKIIYSIQKTSAIKVKGLEAEVRQPFWYVDTDRLEVCARRERKMILRRIKSQAVEYSSQYYDQCSSCREIYDSEKSFRIDYTCEKCGAKYLNPVGKHPNAQWLRDVLKRMNTEISS